jgi:hypothetical protein
MEKQFDYVTKLDIRYDHLQRIDVPQMVKECKDTNTTMTMNFSLFLRDNC